MMQRRTSWMVLWLASGLLLACGSSQDGQGNAAVPGDSLDDVVPAVDDPSSVPTGPIGAGGGGGGSASPAPEESGAGIGSYDPSAVDGPADGEESAAPVLPADDGIVPGDLPPSQLPAERPLTAGAWDDNRNFERFLGYQNDLLQQQMAGLPQFDESAQRAAADASAQASAHATLDIALVIDTTGSMSDELSYLQSEFDALSTAIEAQYPEAEQRWALIVYRDGGDEYEVRSFDFDASPSAFRTRLEAQGADGGGDYPEASDAALEAMNQLAWRADAGTAKLAFWVADAPHHEEKTEALSLAVQVAAQQGVHLYPVASSGVDELTEYSMRAAAQLTLGRYLFLTDDSGVGNSHKEPTIPCYFVTRLDDAILRMVGIEMSGVYREPEAAEVIRASGNPADGACSLAGETLFAF